MDVYYTHSFICKVISFPSGQHTLISLVLWLKMEKTDPPPPVGCVKIDFPCVLGSYCTANSSIYTYI